MKYLFILPLIFACSLVRAQNQFKYEIYGTIKNYKPGLKIYFLRTRQGHALDSLSLTDSVFVFRDSTEISNEPEYNAIETHAQLYLDHSGKGINFNKMSVRTFYDYITVYLEPGITRVRITDSAIKATVIPPALNSGHYTLDSIYTARYKKFSAAVDESQMVQKNDALAVIEKGRRTADSEQEADLWHFVKTHPASPVSLYILKHQQQYYPDYDQISQYFNPLSADLKNTDFGKQYAEMLTGLKATRIGARAPNFAMDDTNGKRVSLSSFKGKYVLVDFWASWCGPCRQENPSVVKAYSRFGGKDFAILGVSLDKTKDAWLKAIMDDNLAWTQVSDLKFWDNAAAQSYSVKAIPQNFLIDPSGHIIAKNLFGEQLTAQLEKIFKDTADSAK